MKNHRGSSASNFHGLLSISSLWNKPSQASDIPIERTFSNESTIETNQASAIKRPRSPPASPTSVSHCDIFRPLRETFFGEEKEDMLTLKRARPICCGASLLDVEGEDEPPEVPLTRQDALMTALELMERAEEDTLDGQSLRTVNLGEDQQLTNKYVKR